MAHAEVMIVMARLLLRGSRRRVRRAVTVMCWSSRTEEVAASVRSEHMDLHRLRGPEVCDQGERLGVLGVVESVW